MTQVQLKRNHCALANPIFAPNNCIVTFICKLRTKIDLKLFLSEKMSYFLGFTKMNFALEQSKTSVNLKNEKNGV